MVNQKFCFNNIFQIYPIVLSLAGRCSIVNYDGSVLCDIMAQPEERITDYRTRWSGIRKKDMENAVPFSQALKTIKKILQVGQFVHCISKNCD